MDLTYVVKKSTIIAWLKFFLHVTAVNLGANQQ